MVAKSQLSSAVEFGLAQAWPEWHDPEDSGRTGWSNSVMLASEDTCKGLLANESGATGVLHTDSG